jgi:proteasome lid subunit RPN8/RPN11
VSDCKAHILEEFPKEACGILSNNIYHRCKNIADDPYNNFIIAPKDLADIQDKGYNIDYIVHSHCNSSAEASIIDLKMMSYLEYKWIIYSCIDGKIVDRKIYDRTGKEI